MREIEEFDENRKGPSGMKSLGDWAGQPRAKITDLFRKISFIDDKP